MSTHEDQFTWFELETLDVDDAVDFYTKIIPWETSVWEDGDEPYTMWTAGGKMLGGVMKLPDEVQAEGAQPVWIGYVSTNDLEEKLEQIEEHGGKRESEVIEMEEAGRMVVVSDPQGAVFALHESTSEDEGELPEQNEPGAVSWVELMTTDVHAAWEFYSDLFGWQKGQRMDMGDGLPYQIFGWQGRDRGGIGDQPDGDVPPSWLFYITVDDIEAGAKRVEEHGGEVVHEPMEVPGGDRIAHFRDPHGALFALHSAGAAA